MNIRLIQSIARLRGVKAIAFAAAAALAAMTGTGAQAETGLVTALSSGQPAAAASFGPNTKVIPASAVRTAADVSPGRISRAVGTIADENRSGSVQQVGFGRKTCNHCMTSSCNGGCNSCGTNGYGRSMACGIPCDPYWYVSVDGLYIERMGEGSFTLIRNAPMNDFDFEWGARVTVGNLPNCVNGYEMSIIAPFKWERSLTVADANVPGSILSNLFDGDGIPATPDPGNFDGTFLDPFDDANLQTQYYSSEYWSAEINKTFVGWDVAKAMVGGRVIQIDEHFNYTSQKTIFSSTADLSSRTENTLVGLQAGLDLLYPISSNVYTDFRGRGGLYYNFAESDVRLRNTGAVVIHNIRDDEDFAGVFEFAFGLRWQLGPMLSVRGGFEAWYITNAATAAGQIDNNVTYALGAKTDIDDDLFYYGGNAGLELKF